MCSLSASIFRDFSDLTDTNAANPNRLKESSTFVTYEMYPITL